MEGFAGHLGVENETAHDGQATLEFQASEEHFNPGGTVHGGVLATLMDTAMASAARSRTEDGEVPATTQLTIAFLSPARPGRLLVSAAVRKQGEHLLLCEADIEQDGRALAHALATFAVL